ncbi:MAG: hypothetical protein WC476_04185 [Phycisphaerae bacterium]|jgi:hypothetical protein
MFWQNDISEGIKVFLIFLGLSSPIITIGLIYYLKKRFEHKQIMAAIEKGTPLSELRLPEPVGQLWIKNLTSGIAVLIIAAAFICIPLLGYSGNYGEPQASYFGVAAILFAVGVSLVIRGLLRRKALRQNQS